MKTREETNWKSEGGKGKLFSQKDVKWARRRFGGGGAKHDNGVHRRKFI